MGDALKQFGQRAVSGQDRSWPAAVARLAAAAVEPGYATAMRVRNRLFDLGRKRTVDLGRPAVSVGNITTGGTGKTPMVIWLARQLAAAGRRPAVLLRGYGAVDPDQGDEAKVLRRALGPDVVVRANPSRVIGAAAVLADRPEVDLFLLDDAFQHRRAARAFDLVLVSATNPFGFGHVLPRGLLREPLAGLGRADGFVITRADAVDEPELARIEGVIRRHNPTAPVYRAAQVHSALLDPRTGVERPITALADRPYFAVAGIGDPDALAGQLQRHGPGFRGHRWFVDHHRYTADDVAAIRQAAGDALVVTTEKDWVKLADVPGVAELKVAVLKLQVRFHGDDGPRLLSEVVAAI